MKIDMQIMAIKIAEYIAAHPEWIKRTPENQGRCDIMWYEYYITDISHKWKPAVQLVRQAGEKSKVVFVQYQTPEKWGDRFNGPRKIPESILKDMNISATFISSPKST